MMPREYSGSSRSADMGLATNGRRQFIAGGYRPMLNDAGVQRLAVAVLHQTVADL
jgi:hypothetical protein